MHHAMLSKTHFNGYDVINVNNGPWRVCTHHDRLGSFATREEAMAFAASLPAFKERTAMDVDGGMHGDESEVTTRTTKH